MLDKLLNYISSQKLFQPEEKILLAISGGIDSMVMAHLFEQTQFHYAIAHCNFQLRGEESEGDQLLVQNIALESKVPFFTTSFNATEYANVHGISIQMAARDLRRAWFDELLSNEKYALIATAHHLNDSIETVLFNLAKGTGISGLKGIPSINGKYIRPMMFATRNMIHDFAKDNHVIWREDQSNSSIKYHRNLIRHNIIPELQKINPNLEQRFAHTAERIAATERVFNHMVNQVKNELLIGIPDGFKIEKAKLKSMLESRIILFEILEKFGFNYDQVCNVLLSIDGQSGKYFYSSKYQLTIDRLFLYISPRSGEDLTENFVEANTHSIEAETCLLTFERVKTEEVEFSKDNNMAFVDYDKLKFPLTIRAWQHGDRFQPLGMQHKKKLSDFMIDEKIPLNLKKHVLLLTSGKNVVWVIGHRIDDRFKISEKTMNVYKICNTLNDDKSI